MNNRRSNDEELCQLFLNKYRPAKSMTVSRPQSAFTRPTTAITAGHKRQTTQILYKPDMSRNPTTIYTGENETTKTQQPFYNLTTNNIKDFVEDTN